MNQAFSAAVQSVTPPFVWNAYQRLRGRAVKSPWRHFGAMKTSTGAKPLLEGRFAELYVKYQPLDPHVPFNVTRYLHYNVCFFAHLCRRVAGDFVCAGVSWGLAPRIVFDFVDFASLGKTLHLVDPFSGVADQAGAKSTRFNTDPDFVLRQYPAGAPVVIHRQPIPLRLPGPLAFVFTNTGDPVADAAAILDFYETLSPGGAIITNQYANNIRHYEPILARLNITPLWLPSGQGVLIKA